MPTIYEYEARLGTVLCGRGATEDAARRDALNTARKASGSSLIELQDFTARRLVEASISPNTRRAYRGALARLDGWLAGRPLTDPTLADYLATLHGTGRAPATASQVLAAARFRCRLAGQPRPDGSAVAAVLRGLKREGRDRGRGQVTGVRWEDVDAAVRIAADHRGASLADRRDAAMVAVASDALLRVSEVAALKVPDVDPEAGTLTVRRSKTDQAGAGAVLFLGPPTVRRVRRWTAAAGLTAGPLFRRVSKAGRVGPRGLHPNSVRAIIQHRAGAAGVQGRVSGHSLRVGAAQSLAAAGAGTAEMQVAGRWKSATMPAHYAAGELAGRGAVARYRYGRTPQ